MKFLYITLGLISVAGAACPPEYPSRYVDRPHGFEICLPAGIKHGAVNDPKGATQFTGFPVPPGTNLEQKSLIIVPGDYDLLENAQPLGQFTANGVTFKRAKLEDASAGHLDLHIIYTPAGKNLHFDFDHRSVNIYNFDPGRRPREYDRAAQIEITEQIMRTYRSL